MTGITLRGDEAAVPWWGAAAGRAIAALDRPWEGRLPLAEQVSARHLWGALRGGSTAPATGPPRRPMLGLSFDLDYQEDTDALDGLVEVVGRVEATMSVVAIGGLVERDAEPYGRALAAGHELVNHTWSHPDNPVLNPDREFWDLSTDEMVEEVVRAQDVFDERLGTRPTGFRTPHFKDAHRLVAALESVPEMSWLSSVLASDTPTGLPYRPARTAVAGARSHLFEPDEPAHRSRLLQLPLTACPDHRWSPLCSYHTFRGPHRPDIGQGFHLDLDEVATLWERMLVHHRSAGYVVVYLDPKDVMRDADTADAFTRMLSAAVVDGWEVTSLGAVATAWWDGPPTGRPLPPHDRPGTIPIEP